MSRSDGLTAVFLVGFMGCGKTAAGRSLARNLGRRFVDTDRMVEDAEGRSIERIFGDSGEGRFRDAEHRVLLSLGTAVDTVVSTGGGLFAGAAERRHMKSIGVTVWLDAPLCTIRDRVSGGSGRPLWPADDPIELRALFEKRRAVYALADHRIEASGEPPDVVAEAIRLRLESVGSLIRS